MPSTDDVLKAARELGDLVSETDVAEKYRASIARLDKDTDAQRAVADLNRFIMSLAQKQQAGQPIEVAEKQQLETLQTAVVMHPTLRSFQQAQVDFVDLLRKVDEAIQEANELPEPDMAPGGDAGAGAATGPMPGGAGVILGV